jgi:hypothetical protein
MKIKLAFFVAALLVLCHFFYSCDDIVERDLSKQWVYGITPQDFSVSTLITQTFKWKEVKGAESYNLQIYKTESDFSTIKEFVADTNVRSTQYVCSLKSGYYKWQIYAQNNGGHSGLSIFRFQIDSTGELGQQKVELLSPVNNYSTDTLDQVFTWTPIPAATSYNFQIFAANSTTASVSEIIKAPNNSYKYSFLKVGTYSWQVTATNGVSSTPPSSFNLTIDTASVPVPTLISPVNDTTTVTGSYVSLKWNSVKNATSYYVQVTRNTSSSQMDTSATIETPLVTFCNYYYSDKNKLGTKYYWRVKAKQQSREGNFSNWVLFKHL